MGRRKCLKSELITDRFTNKASETKLEHSLEKQNTLFLQVITEAKGAATVMERTDDLNTHL